MRIVYALVLAVTASLLWFNLHIKPISWIVGDSFEYVMMSESFLRHGDPELTPADYAYAATLTGKITNMSGFVPPHYNAGPPGYLLSKGGRYFSVHFWIYPLVNVPALVLTNALDWPPTYSFIVTNSALLLIALAAIFFWCPWLTNAQKIVVAAGAVFCGTTYYLNWNHPEVSTFLATLLGAACLYGNRFKSAAVLFALAAQQNPPVGVLCAVALLLEAWEIFKARADWKGSVQRLGICAAIGALLLLHPLFYYYHFGVGNLIASRSSAAYYPLISTNRLIYFFLDLDQGMIVGMPYLLLGLILCLVARAYSRANPVVLAVLCVAPIAFAALAASTNNWNSGHQVFMRYAFWACAPWIVLLAAALEGEMTRFKIIAVTAFVVGQMSVVAAFGVLGWGQWHNNRTKASAFAFDHFWGVYNPPAPTFINRGNVPVSDRNLYVWVRDRLALKIAFNTLVTSAAAAVEQICRGPVPTDRYRVRYNESGWRYVNLHEGCPVAMERGVNYAVAR